MPNQNLAELRGVINMEVYVVEDMMMDMEVDKMADKVADMQSSGSSWWNIFHLPVDLAKLMEVDK